MAKKKEENSTEDDGLNLKEYIKSFEESMKMQENYLNEVDWKNFEVFKEKESHYILSIEILEVLISQAETILTKCNNNPPKYAEDVLKRIVNVVDKSMTRMKKYSDTKSKTTLDFKSESFKEELSFITSIGKDSVKLNKRLSKIKLKEAGTLNIKLKGDQFPSLASKVVLEQRFPEIKEFVENRVRNFKQVKKNV